MKDIENILRNHKFLMKDSDENWQHRIFVLIFVIKKNKKNN